jgi:hypothetical protein
LPETKAQISGNAYLNTHPANETYAMPSLSRLFQRLSTAIPSGSGPGESSQHPFYASDPAPSDPRTITTHYLSTPLPPHDSPYPALRDTPSPSSAPMAIPPNTLLFTFTHPTLDSSPATQFFLHCLPDPIGFLHHCVVQITSYLSPSFPHPREYRHQSLTLILDPNYDGLAATSGGQLRVSLQWVQNVKSSVEQGREIEDATKEFKGVLLHELTHALQHDGYGSTPTWFTESIADWIRLRNGLGPKHWKRCGEGNREKGWETGYDVGAWFLDYLVGEGIVGGLDWAGPDAGGRGSTAAGGQGPTPTTTQAQPQPTTYTAPPPNHQSPYPKPRPSKPRPRAPIPDLVRNMDSRLERERWSDTWWVEMVGAPIEVLWREYQDYYS